MARILISYFSNYGEAMYDAISQQLLNNGNEVFRLNINNSGVKNTSWGGVSKIVDKHLLVSIKNFNPDIIFNFNNSLPKNCYEYISEKCKICIIDADAPQVAFWNKDVVYRNLNRIFFLGLQSYSKQMYESFLGISLNENNYLYFPPGTIVKNEKLSINKNIVFIGSNFYSYNIPFENDFYTKEAIELYDVFQNNYFLSYDEALKIFPNCSSKIYKKIREYYVGQERLKYLQQLTDLGLTIYGVRWWNKIAYYDFDLAKCFNPTQITSIEDNQSAYNSSKIAINISHPLAKTSFSWRVMDIMASGACLLMEDKPDWRDLFEKYLSKETLDAIIYKDRFDMREKVIKLLNDEELRLRCVKDLNNAIDKNGRWNSRLLNLGNFLSIKLVDNSIKNTRYIYIERDIDTDATKSPSGKLKKHFIQLKKIFLDIKKIPSEFISVLYYGFMYLKSSCVSNMKNKYKNINF